MSEQPLTFGQALALAKRDVKQRVRKPKHRQQRDARGRFKPQQKGTAHE